MLISQTVPPWTTDSMMGSSSEKTSSVETKVSVQNHHVKTHHHHLLFTSVPVLLGKSEGVLRWHQPVIQEEHSHTMEVKEKDMKRWQNHQTQGVAHSMQGNPTQRASHRQLLPSWLKAVCAGVFLDGVTCSYVSFTCVREWGIEGNSIYSTK